MLLSSSPPITRRSIPRYRHLPKQGPPLRLECTGAIAASTFASSDGPLSAAPCPANRRGAEKHGEGTPLVYRPDAMNPAVEWAMKSHCRNASLSGGAVRIVAGTSPNALGRTFGPQVVAERVPLNITQRILGHASQQSVLFGQAERQRMLREASRRTGRVKWLSRAPWTRPQLDCQDVPLRSGERETLGRAAVCRQLIQSPRETGSRRPPTTDKTVVRLLSQASSQGALLAGRTQAPRRASLVKANYRDSAYRREADVQYISLVSVSTVSGRVPIGDTARLPDFVCEAPT